MVFLQSSSVVFVYLQQRLCDTELLINQSWIVHLNGKQEAVNWTAFGMNGPVNCDVSVSWKYMCALTYSCVDELQVNVAQSLDFLDSVRGLANIRDAVWELLVHSVNPRPALWGCVCQYLLNKHLSIWDHFFRPLFLSRIKVQISDSETCFWCLFCFLCTYCSHRCHLSSSQCLSPFSTSVLLLYQWSSSSLCPLFSTDFSWFLSCQLNSWEWY